MKIEFLGTGGAITIPRPGCDCRVCAEARASGGAHARSGPALYVHGPDLLIDTPEEIKDQLNRAGLGFVPACTYSHWHPDHTMGRRVWEMNFDWRHWPPQSFVTDLYLPQQVAADFRQRLGTWEHLEYFRRMGLVRLRELQDGERFTLGETAIRPFRLAEAYVYGFLLEEGGRRALIVMDELFGWEPPEDLGPVDLAVLPMGICDVHPLTGARQIPEGHPLLRTEATFVQTLDVVRRLQAGQVYLTHIEEPDGVTPADLAELSARLQSEGLNVAFAHDGLAVVV